MPYWTDVGNADKLKQKELTEVTLGKTKLAISYKSGEFGIISGVCNHVGGPLAEGKLDGDYVVCPWHFCKFHHKLEKVNPDMKKTKYLRTILKLKMEGSLLIWIQLQKGINFLMRFIH